MNLSDRAARPEGTVVDVRGVAVGGPAVVVMAGPCAVESHEQLLAAARAVIGHGGILLPMPEGTGSGPCTCRCRRRAPQRGGVQPR